MLIVYVVMYTPPADLEERCYEGNGVDYRGTISTTLSGAHCLPWSSELLHTELSLANADTAALLANVESTMQLGLGDHAFCRYGGISV